MRLEQTWRWFGPNDPTTLQDIKQTGATGIVTALHHLPIGQVWSVDEIQIRMKQIEDADLRWSVVESIPVHEDIKRHSGDYKKWTRNYKLTIQNLGKCGINVLCYNFMPVLDWTRTDLNYPMNDGSTALRFDEVALAAFDLFILNRPGADEQLSPEIIQQAEKYFKKLSEAEKTELTNTILAGLPGSEEGYTLGQFRKILKTYEGITASDLQYNLKFFLKKIVPVAEAAGIRLAIHPDDPAFSLFGLPRVVSTEQDIAGVIGTNESFYNGWTLCTGSFGSNPVNDLAGMVKRLGHHINFVHLRNIKIENHRTFHEADHLDGDINMVAVMKELLSEMDRRNQANRSDIQLPMRPDHGHNMLTELTGNNFPGYSCIGRLRGLAELRGLELGIRDGLAQT
ncbi:mannonate dehydratase [soil metagenome]